MRVAIPHMGNLYIPFEAMFKQLNVDFVIQPLCNQRTMNLGVKYSPEGLCVPYKLTLGSLIEAAEMGADTLLMPIGFGICRLGYYAKMHEQVLHELGFNFKMLTLRVSDQKLVGVLRLIKYLANDASWPKIISAFRFGLAKLNTLDKLEQTAHRIRPLEQVSGTTNKIFNEAIEAVRAADTHRELKKVRKDCLARFEQLPKKDIHPIIVGITGEFYVLLEPFSNLDLESELGKLGVEVRRSFFMSEWTKFSLFLNPLGFDEKRDVHKAAMPYLKRDVGGDGWESVGEKVLHAKQYDGLIHLAPFTCMPEIVAENIMLRTRENIPVLTVLCDEQLAKAGLVTRLEAFVDLLARRRSSRNKVAV
ncbi:MAG: CoA protein activase [Chloroflexi bacterium]|nr:CoA protein activase [Chloroflexota bacterium]